MRLFGSGILAVLLMVVGHLEFLFLREFPEEFAVSSGKPPTAAVSQIKTTAERGMCRDGDFAG